MAQYEALVDAADVAAAEKTRADIVAGRDEMVPATVADRLLDGENPVRGWREHRGLSGKEIAGKAAISPGYLSEIEGGGKQGGTATMAKIAAALDLTIDDLI